MDERARSAEPQREPDGLRFGVFEMDLRSGELRRSGVLVKLAPQPFQLLGMLARSRGAVLTREEIRKRIWGDGTFVDFDQRLNSCVNQVRQALSDDADAPRFIETLPKRGYRWLAVTEDLHNALPRPALHVVVPFGNRDAPTPVPLPPPDPLAATPVPEPPAPLPSPARGLVSWGHALLTLAAIGAAIALYLARPAPNGSAQWKRVTYQRGAVLAASFAPGGEIVYSAAWEGGPRKSYVSTLSGPDSRPLELQTTAWLRVSQQGELAYFRADSDTRVLARAPLTGGSPRDIEKRVLYADWMPDGRELAIVRQADSGVRIELPLGHDVGGVEYVSSMRVSPDGRRVAMVEHPLRGDDGGYILVIDRAGVRRRLTAYWSSLQGLAWSPRGDEVWFAGARGNGLLGLQAVSLSGKERTLLQTGSRLVLHDIDASGRVLLDSGVSRAGARFGRKGGTERDLSWFDSTLAVQLSADGNTLLFIEGGDAGGPEYGIYVRGTDGAAPPVRLGAGRALSLSPDGQAVLAIPVHDPAQIELIPTGPGRRRILKHDGFTRYDWAGFAGDARHMLFVGMKKGATDWQASLQDIDGQAPPKPLGNFRMVRDLISPDGTKLVRMSEKKPCMLDIATGETTPLPLAGDVPQWWDKDGRHLFVRDAHSYPAVISRLDIKTGAKTPWLELGPTEMVGVQRISEIFGTPDGSAYVYNYFRRLSDLFVVEGLR